MKTFLSYRFLPFNIAFIHATLTAPSFGNLYIMISSTLLCFYAALSITCHGHIPHSLV